MASEQLHPTVIRPLKASINGLEFTYDGEELLKTGYPFESDLTRYIPLLEPILTKAGKIAVRQPQPIKKKKDWWQAQCAFRGLLQSGNIADLQHRLRMEGETGLLSELASAEVKLEQEFRDRSAKARDEKWQKPTTTDEEKAGLDIDRFLREAFDSRNNNVVVLKVDSGLRAQVHKAADSLGLENLSTDAPPSTHEQGGPRTDRWIVIARDRAVLKQKLDEIAQQTKQERKQLDDDKKAELRRKHAKAQKEAKATQKRGGSWDIFGTWAISCPYAESQWGFSETECSLTIYEVGGGNDDRKQIWAEFDLIAITGVFRFVRPTSGRADGGSAGDRKRKRSEAEFILGPEEGPSPSQATWAYRWRGEETGEGEIQLFSDDNSYSVTFSGPRGTKLKGTFGGGCFKECDFTGLKIGGRVGTHSDPEREWRNRDEDAYERARTGRWH